MLDAEIYDEPIHCRPQTRHQWPTDAARPAHIDRYPALPEFVKAGAATEKERKVRQSARKRVTPFMMRSPPPVKQQIGSLCIAPAFELSLH